MPSILGLYAHMTISLNAESTGKKNAVCRNRCKLRPFPSPSYPLSSVMSMAQGLHSVGEGQLATLFMVRGETEEWTYLALTIRPEIDPNTDEIVNPWICRLI